MKNRFTILDEQASLIQEIFDPRWTTKGIRFFVKRDDLLAIIPDDPFCGNKWRKLKYNLEFADTQGFKRLLSFGGAYSNHIAALASAGKHFDFETTGIIRGEKVSNPTLQRAIRDGMHLEFISRSSYRQKNDPTFLKNLREQYGECYIIPEGGTNGLALKGCKELGEEIINQCPAIPTHIALACGTGGTFVGLASGLPAGQKAIGVSVLKGDFMGEEVENIIRKNEVLIQSEIDIQNSYHHGGYAKSSSSLLAFMDEFNATHGIRLEPIYTGKLFYALNDMIEKNYFPKGSCIVGVHTGGLQGQQV